MNLGVLINRMIVAGIDPAEAGSIAAEIYALGVASASVRSTGAERTRRWREKNASQCDGLRHAVTACDAEAEASPNVTKRHEPSHCDDNAVLPIDTKIKSISKQNSNRPSRGTRIDPSWIPSEADRLLAKQEGFSSSEIDREAARFRDYWTGRAGAGGVKLDWSATWRNWVRTAGEKLGKAPQSSAPTGDIGDKFYAKFGSEEQDAWDSYARQRNSPTFPRDSRGGWVFPTRWPPGYEPLPDNDTAPKMQAMQ